MAKIIFYGRGVIMDEPGTEVHQSGNERRKNSSKVSNKAHEVPSRESISSTVWDGECSKNGTSSASSAGKKRRRQHAQDIVRCVSRDKAT